MPPRKYTWSTVADYVTWTRIRSIILEAVNVPQINSDFADERTMTRPSRAIFIIKCQYNKWLQFVYFPTHYNGNYMNCAGKNGHKMRQPTNYSRNNNHISFSDYFQVHIRIRWISNLTLSPMVGVMLDKQNGLSRTITEWVGQTAPNSCTIIILWLWIYVIKVMLWLTATDWGIIEEGSK